MPINFYIPNFWNFYKLNTFLIQHMKEVPEKFYDDVKIASIYGSFPSAIWNGGRGMGGEYADDDNIINTIQGVNDLDVAVRFTFTNCLLKDYHTEDAYCNRIMEAANNGMNEVVINSPVLEQYLREKYPNFNYISSTTKCLLEDVDIINEADKYDLTVLDYRRNRDIEFLKSLENKDKYELLINAYCNPNCTRRADHYIYLSKQQIEHSRGDLECAIRANNFFDALKFSSVIKADELYKTYYQELGFTNFKIEGRTNSVYDVIESYVYYLVKPEYKDEIRLLLCKNI